ncbi:MAG: DUF1553 domain-containing protein [Verrucomicrobiales bacterium]|nr:DUF1553 domain-containing protein [Verrucomicrobiales bacterium]
MRRLRILSAAVLCGWIAALGLVAQDDHRPRKTSDASGASHWSYVPPREVPPPAAPGANPVDAFLQDELHSRGVRPAPPATPETWLRRVTYDLTGLLPTPEERTAFLSDPSPRARERIVDRLLASPRYGERWAQHWLDLAHYADSNGFELDADRPDAWRYRDWVVSALNRDLPYDAFLTLQIAGDEAVPGDPDALVAAGFARAGPREVVSGNIDPDVKRQNELTEATGTVGSVFLGLTIGCARCHDHKFDPIPTADYYRLQAYFAGAQLKEVPIHSLEETNQFQAAAELLQKQIDPLEEARNALEKPSRDRLRAAKESRLTPAERAVRDKRREDRTPEEQRLAEGVSTALNVTWEEVAEAVAQNPSDFATREDLKRRIHALKIRMPPPPAHAMTLAEDPDPLPETRVLARGNLQNRRQPVEPSPPAVLLASTGPIPSPVRIDPNRSGRRLALARWLVQPRHPLTARVLVNRIWQHHFGKGLVATPSDFGARGARPSHPDLLDWLALQLERDGWRLEPMHRRLVLSDAYARTSDPGTRPDAAALDPDNRLLWRMNRRRMDAEGLRDCVLEVAGTLNLKSGGPGVRAPLEPEVRDLIFTEAEVVDLWPVDPDPSAHARRSLYLHHKRNVPYPLLNAFDAPDALTPCPERSVSTHAPQALVLLNSRFALESASALARSLRMGSPDPATRITEAWLRCYGRAPTTGERTAALEFIASSPGPEEESWTDFALALLNSNEFIHVP